MTKIANVWVTGLAAVFAITFGFFGYIQAFIISIPSGVLGGMTIVLYGLIAGNGVKVMIQEKVDLSDQEFYYSWFDASNWTRWGINIRYTSSRSKWYEFSRFSWNRLKSNS